MNKYTKYIGKTAFFIAAVAGGAHALPIDTFPTLYGTINKAVAGFAPIFTLCGIVGTVNVFRIIGMNGDISKRTVAMASASITSAFFGTTALFAPDVITITL